MVSVNHSRSAANASCEVSHSASSIMRRVAKFIETDMSLRAFFMLLEPTGSADGLNSIIEAGLYANIHPMIERTLPLFSLLLLASAAVAADTVPVAPGVAE